MLTFHTWFNNTCEVVYRINPVAQRDFGSVEVFIERARFVCELHHERKLRYSFSFRGVTCTFTRNTVSASVATYLVEKMLGWQGAPVFTLEQWQKIATVEG